MKLHSVQNSLDGKNLEKSVSVLRRRYYHALKTGLEYHYGDFIGFMTLTSPPGACSVLVSWSFLLSKIHRKFKKFEYILLETAEGYGVLHIIFTGSYIPFRWLQKSWSKIHGEPIGYMGNLQVNVEKVKDLNKVSKYLVSQYLAGQSSMRSWTMSRHWLWKGYRLDWITLVKTYGFQQVLPHWRVLVMVKAGERDGNDLY